jgi:hypothetical protein
MRKQYHFRPSDRGLLAWDVDRLIALSGQLPRRAVPLDAIDELDEAYWFGGEDDQPTCRAIIEHARLIEQAELRYPIILSASGRVMDGMHRVGKALLQGHTTIDAVQFDTDPAPDYVGRPPDTLPY